MKKVGRHFSCFIHGYDRTADFEADNSVLNIYYGENDIAPVQAFLAVYSFPGPHALAVFECKAAKTTVKKLLNRGKTYTGMRKKGGDRI